MTLRKFPQCVSYSVSPIDGIGAFPLFGTASAALDKEVDATEIDGVAPPLEVADHEEPGLSDVPGGVGEEEMRKAKMSHRPVLPTKAEIYEHFPLHLHCRSWCRHCRSGKGRLVPRLVEPPDMEKLGVTFSADYAFMGSEEAEKDMQPSLIMYDDDKGAFWAAGVRAKGVSEAVVKYVKDILDQSGYDGEK